MRKARKSCLPGSAADGTLRRISSFASFEREKREALTAAVKGDERAKAALARAEEELALAHSWKNPDKIAAAERSVRNCKHLADEFEMVRYEALALLADVDALAQELV